MGEIVYFVVQFIKAAFVVVVAALASVGLSALLAYILKKWGGWDE